MADENIQTLYEGVKQLSMKDWAIVLVLVALAAFLFMLALNQATGYFYKMRLLLTPCQLCLQQNPAAQLCAKYIPSNITFGG